MNETTSYRVDFFGDTVDEIKILNTENQRSKEPVDEIIVMPSKEVFFTDDEVEVAKYCINEKLSSNINESAKKKYEEDLEKFENPENSQYLQRYLSLFIKENYSFIDYIDNKVVCYVDYDSILKQNDASQIEKANICQILLIILRINRLLMTL